MSNTTRSCGTQPMAGRNVARQIIASTVRGYGDRLRADLGQTATGPALVAQTPRIAAMKKSNIHSLCSGHVPCHVHVGPLPASGRSSAIIAEASSSNVSCPSNSGRWEFEFCPRPPDLLARDHYRLYGIVQARISGPNRGCFDEVILRLAGRLIQSNTLLHRP